MLYFMSVYVDFFPHSLRHNRPIRLPNANFDVKWKKNVLICISITLKEKKLSASTIHDHRFRRHSNQIYPKPHIIWRWHIYFGHSPMAYCFKLYLVMLQHVTTALAPHFNGNEPCSFIQWLWNFLFRHDITM